MFAGHEAFLHIAQLQVVDLQHVLLLLLLQGVKETHSGEENEEEDFPDKEEIHSLYIKKRVALKGKLVLMLHYDHSGL